MTLPSTPRHGLLLLDKPKGLSSMAAVSRIKRILGIRKAGHTGTLDPIATGLLPICLGHATRVAGMLLATNKAYRAELMLGVATNTCDAEGEVSQEASVPEELDEAQWETFLEAYRGDIEQVPPAFSALKVKGKRAYQLAREGKEVVLEARSVHVERLLLEHWEAPHARLFCAVSKGTYIRSLIRDLGNDIGCGAHMTALRRTQVGPFSLEDAISLEELRENPEAAHQHIITLFDLFPDWPVFELTDHEERLFGNGAIPHSFAERQPLADAPHRILSRDGRLMGFVTWEDKWKVMMIFPEDPAPKA
ncbi:MAG: tRNA pseudouridine(55) synthase TruB [Deltaproteobacteria bacterium]|nr:MAG: tRNA pseudouridine(55) synthase TruB [Deltaproteobacteria bacterium]